MYHGFANSVKNIANNAVMGVSEKLDLNSPPTTDHFRLNGRLSPSEFVRVGDKLVDSCGSWTWSKSQNPNYKNIYLDENKQFLVLRNVQNNLILGEMWIASEQYNTKNWQLYWKRRLG
jgi:hypothetical protein